MDVTLVVVKPDGETQDVRMKRERLVIGRQEGCDIRIPVPSVSREHCELRLADEKLTLRDLGSSNGTFVNKERVREVELQPGDTVALGPMVFVVRINGRPAAVDAHRALEQGAPAPVVAARPAKARPAAPSGAKPKPAPKKDAEDDLDFDSPSDSSISDLDLDFLNEDEEEPKL